MVRRFVCALRLISTAPAAAGAEPAVEVDVAHAVEAGVVVAVRRAARQPVQALPMRRLGQRVVQWVAADLAVDVAHAVDAAEAVERAAAAGRALGLRQIWRSTRMLLRLSICLHSISAVPVTAVAAARAADARVAADNAAAAGGVVAAGNESFPHLY